MGLGGQRHAPAALMPRKGNVTRFTGGWLGPRAGLNWCGKPILHRDPITEPSSPLRTTIPIELPRPNNKIVAVLKYH